MSICWICQRGELWGDIVGAIVISSSVTIKVTPSPLGKAKREGYGGNIVGAMVLSSSVCFAATFLHANPHSYHEEPHSY